MKLHDKQKKLGELRKKIESCTRCELHKTVNKRVIYRGHEDPIILFVGEAPGYHEDQKGKPFIGRAGRILDTLISRLGVDEYGILNLVKCRPPDNKFDKRYMIVCTVWLDQQIHLLNPKLIVALGAWPTSYFFGGGIRVLQVAGTTREVNGCTVFACLHPASILHSPKYKETFDECSKKLQLLTMQMGIRRKMTWF